MQQTVNLNLILDQVAKDKGIDRPRLIEILEEAIESAAKRHFGLERNLKARYDEEKGQVDLFQVLTIVGDPTEEAPIADPTNMVPVSVAQEKGIDVEPGDELDFPIYYRSEDEAEARAQDEQWGDLLKLKTYRRSFGRIAAQTAKQVMIHGTRNAERENVFNEYKDRKGEVITGIVRRFERGNVIVDLGRAEAVLPVREQVPRESYRAGDRIQAYVMDVLRESKGPQIILSRASVDLLKRLFEMEVPEIAEGVVVIEAAAREPGGRAKIAVSSRDSDVDPVGACVGMKGSRVQAVVQEMQGEKIDIIPWSEDTATFVVNALQPATVQRVVIDEDDGRIEVVVPDDQLSLAIGRRGQNVRLASQLTAKQIDIMTEADASEKRQREFIERSTMFQEELDVDETLAQLLVAEGFGELEEVAYVPLEELAGIEGFDEELAEELQSRATEALERREEAARAERRELGVEDALAEIPHLTEAMLVTLGKAGIKTLDDLADLATDELIAKKRSDNRRGPSRERAEDRGGVLGEYGLSEEQGNEIIMAARAHWFDDEPAPEAEVASQAGEAADADPAQ